MPDTGSDSPRRAATPRRETASGGPDGYRWVTSGEGIEELGRSLREHDMHGLDTESNSGFVYRERLCLLQVNVGGTLWLVDLVALDDPRDLEPLREPLESPATRTVLHGGEFDVGCFKRDYDLALGGVWDTQQAASCLGWERTGYGSVVEVVCSVKLDKAFSHHDWGRRPVMPKALVYAVDDVRYLPRIAEHLEREIVAADLVEELEIANRVVMEARWTPRGGTDVIWRTKGVRRLPSEALPRLVALWEWREGVARVEDRPPGRVLNTQVLLSLARRSRTTARDLRGSVLRGRSRVFADDIAEVLRRAAARPPRVPEPPRGTRPAAGEGKRLKRLRDWRRAEAERRSVPHHVVLPPTAIQHLARHGADDLGAVPQLGEKRVRLYGDRLRELCG